MDGYGTTLPTTWAIGHGRVSYPFLQGVWKTPYWNPDYYYISQRKYNGMGVSLLFSRKKMEKTLYPGAIVPFQAISFSISKFCCVKFPIRKLCWLDEFVHFFFFFLTPDLSWWQATSEGKWLSTSSMGECESYSTRIVRIWSGFSLTYSTLPWYHSSISHPPSFSSAKEPCELFQPASRMGMVWFFCLVNLRQPLDDIVWPPPFLDWKN